MKNLTISIVIALITNAFCYGQEKYSYSQPSDLNDGWKTNSLLAKHVDTTLIHTLFNKALNKDNKLHSVLLIKNGELIIEEYFNGAATNLPHDLRSTTKSIRSILMGIAIDKGFIENVNDPIFKYLKSPTPLKNLDNRKSEITIKQLLTMSSGLDCNDWNKSSKGQEDKVYKKKDWLQYTLDLPVINEPGSVSNYCSMGAILIAEIISQASGITIAEFAQKYLFNPLQITNINWGHTTNKKIISSGKRLYMTSRDMAKIGQLILNKGSWKGNQIISENWVEEATTPKTKITGIDYGYFWWNIPFKVKNNHIISKVATGNGGQYIMIFPELELVAVFTGSVYNSQEDKVPFAIMQDIFLPSLAQSK
ncbi:serine hydrolase [Aurantibacter sp.]|uniref:serine hydrolase domain-containing protein n=1 Tax=Aurantibacter sp. TaxID=2807103 RepID=UPI00326425F2